jgi:hypothetical protein
LPMMMTMMIMIMMMMIVYDMTLYTNY